ncbi:MAG: sterol desaturase family protein [Bdellovibrionales bacterium]
MKKDNKETVKRFSHNFLHVLISQVLLFLFFYIVGKNFFEFSNVLRVGLFYHLDLPNWVELIAMFIVFDLALYLQHRASHRWAWFWNIHKMHHSDKVMTTSTAVRFHFLEIFISAFWKGVLITLLGASLRNFMWFEVFLSSCALFNHSNLKIKESLNQFIEKFLMTPELHRIHHSTDLRLTHSNFGFSVILWDKLFNSFNENQDVPKIGVEGLEWESFKSQILLKNK